jgi:hypothetical protein
MIRRLALLFALLGPAVALGQTAGNLVVVPTAFGAGDCATTPRAVTITWTSTSALAIATGDVYKIYLSTASIACSSATPGVTQFRTDVTASSLTQTYPGTGDASLSTAQAIAGASIACGTTATINVCVQHVGTSSTTPKGYAQGTVEYEAVAPPVPTGVTLQPGDSSLFVSWTGGSSTGVPAVSYTVRAVATANAADFKEQSFTGTSNNRISGLTNGVTYSVTVRAVSASGNLSGFSTDVALGTPQPVSGFWEQYKKDQGIEEGGCGGGPAGAVALLGVALALRGLRRRS